MKFTDLYKQVIISEDNTEVADPADPSFQDVADAPIPLPSPKSNTEEGGTSGAGMGGGSLQDYKSQIEEFIDKLTNPQQESLLALVAGLDKENTPYKGISRVNSNIAMAAKALGDVLVDINGYLINIAKNPNPVG